MGLVVPIEPGKSKKVLSKILEGLLKRAILIPAKMKSSRATHFSIFYQVG